MNQSDAFQGSPWQAEPTEDWNRPAYWDQYYQMLTEGKPWQRNKVVHREVELLIQMLTESGELPAHSPPRKILDAGCGIALIPHVLAYWGFQITAVDACPRAIEAATQLRPTEEELAQCVPIWDPCADWPGCWKLVEDPVRSLQRLRSFQTPGGFISHLAGDWCAADLPSAAFNIIYCRNSLRCSTKPYWRRSLRRFHELLTAGGILLLETVNAIGIRKEVEELLAECGLAALPAEGNRESGCKYVISRWPTGELKAGIFLAGRFLGCYAEGHRTIFIPHQRVPVMAPAPLPVAAHPLAPAPLAAALQGFLQPGGHWRLSPQVEAALCAVLLGERPHPARHAQSLTTILARPTARLRLQELAQVHRSSPQGWAFDAVNYSSPAHLERYLLHYFPANLAKHQLVLLDLLRSGRWPEELHVLDLGCGPGVGLIAVADFVLSLATIADLQGCSLPLQDLSLRGVDSSAICIGYAERMRDRYLDQLEIISGAGPALAQAVKLVRRALQNTAFKQADALQPDTIDAAAATVAIASYVFRQLTARAQQQPDSRFPQLAPEALLLALAPGDVQSFSMLMRWRRTLLEQMPELAPLLPCGQEFPELPPACTTCWWSRQEGWHLGPLQRAWLRALEALDWADPDDREKATRSLRRLSWSYFVLGPRTAVATPLPEGSQRALGSHHAGMETPEQVAPSRRLVLCPAHAPAKTRCTALALQVEPGKTIPVLGFGEPVVLVNATWRQEGNEGVFGLNRNSRLDLVERPPEPPALFPSPAAGALDALGRRLFGFPRLREFQQRVIQRILAGRNTLAIAATGAGKTECFLLPALLLPGLTVVVSPLKSLMQDQVERCAERYDLGEVVTFINSDVHFSERMYRLRGLRSGRYQVVYFTPEQLARGAVLALLRDVRVSLLAVDEAHCISQWGHDFRPDYLNLLRRVRDAWPRQPVLLALTGTASARVRHELCSAALLGVDPRPDEQGGDVVLAPANRPELELIVRVVPNAEERGGRIVEDLRQAVAAPEGSALVFLPYTGVGKSAPACGLPGVEPFAAFVERELGQPVALYHGQLWGGDCLEMGAVEATLLRLRYRSGDGKLEVWEFRGADGFFSAVGILPNACPGQSYCLVGGWIYTERYGRQFKFDRAESLASSSPALPPITLRSRREEQQAFMHGERRIMIATKSFGMGIDKANIRLVVHHSPPGDLLAYAQEIGRAARDGQPARAVLCFTEGPYRESRKRLTDRWVQERFLRNRHVREQDLRAVVAFLLQVPRRLQAADAPGGLLRTFAIFTAEEAIEFFNGLRQQPERAGLRAPYTWPAHREQHTVVQIALEVLFRTSLPSSDHVPPQSLLDSCDQVFLALSRPPRIDLRRLDDTNAEFLRAVLDGAGLSAREFADLCQEAGRTDLLPLARRLGLSLRETGEVLREARDLGVLADLGLTNRQPDGSPGGMAWEVGLSPALTDSKAVTRHVETVVAEHRRRQREDERDFQLMLEKYVGVGHQGKALPCLRQVLLRFLDTGEEVVEEGCGACSRCCHDGDFIPVAERAQRVIVFPPALWQDLREVRLTTDQLPDLDLLERIRDFLDSPEGARWRGPVALNTERVLQDDPGSIGAMALLALLIAHGWWRGDTERLGTLVEALCRQCTGMQERLLRFVELVAAKRPCAIVLHWQIRLTLKDNRAAFCTLWKRLLEQPDVTRAQLREAATLASWDEAFARLAIRLTLEAPVARRGYKGLPTTALAAKAKIVEEARAILALPVSEQERAEVLAGLILAVRERVGDRVILQALQEVRGCHPHGNEPEVWRQLNQSLCRELDKEWYECSWFVQLVRWWYERELRNGINNIECK